MLTSASDIDVSRTRGNSVIICRPRDEVFEFLCNFPKNGRKWFLDPELGEPPEVKGRRGGIAVPSAQPINRRDGIGPGACFVEYSVLSKDGPAAAVTKGDDGEDKVFLHTITLEQCEPSRRLAYVYQIKVVDGETGEEDSRAGYEHCLVLELENAPRPKGAGFGEATRVFVAADTGGIDYKSFVRRERAGTNKGKGWVHYSPLALLLPFYYRGKWRRTRKAFAPERKMPLLLTMLERAKAQLEEDGGAGGGLLVTEPMYKVLAELAALKGYRDVTDEDYQAALGMALLADGKDTAAGAAAPAPVPAPAGTTSVEKVKGSAVAYLKSE